MKKILQKWFFPVLIFLITTFIAFKNYTPGTFLTGWDNLHPEFDFKLNIIRSLNTAWQEYQGVGLLGGMAHAADLPRQILLFFISLILPSDMIRYFWTFLMLFLGPLGVYYLLTLTLNDRFSLLRVSPLAKTSRSTAVIIAQVSAFVGSIFYIFNLATVQYYFVPFETFVAFYGFLPWLIYSVLRYLKSGKTYDLLWYFLISIIAASAFYVQTLFLVYGVFLTVLCIAAVFKKFKTGVKRSLLILLVTLIVNGFWLFPVSWFSITSPEIPINSQINRIASPETVYMNLGRNSFSDIANLKGYWFDYYDFQASQGFDTNGEFVYLFQDWISYTENIWVGRAGIMLFIFAMFGFLIKRRIAYLVLSIMSFVFLAGFVPQNSVLTEAFRNSFTKWSVAFAFLVSLGLGQFVSLFKKISILPAILIIAASVYTTYPIFEGKLISQRVKYDIPEAYFETFDWFNSQTNGERIAYFPAFDKWGWNYHSWGYGGSGFVWYGMKNPVIDRAFNVWSPYNEGFYNELARAVLAGDRETFKNTLEKYQVRYLLLDESVLFPWGGKDLLKLDVIKAFSDQLGFEKVWEQDFLKVMDTHINTDNFVSAPENYTFIDADLTYSPVDNIYKKFGNYIQPLTINHQSSVIGFPFTNLDPRSDVEISLQTVGTGLDQLVFDNKKTNSEARLLITEKNEETFEEGHGYENSFNCDLKKNGSVERTILNHSRNYKAENGGVACDYFVFGDVQPSTGYVLHVKGENKAGRSLKVYLYNWESKRVEIEELLPEGNFDSYFVIYPKLAIDNQSLIINSGYTLNVETRSFGGVSSENEINTLEMIAFDYDLITNLQIDTENSKFKTNNRSDDRQISNLQLKSVTKYGTAIYKVEVTGDGLLQLGQGFEPGWLALEVSPSRSEPVQTGFKLINTDFKLLDHVKVNTWSNGWLISQNQSEPVQTGLKPVVTVYILFWPQLLEWFGLLLLPLTGGILVLKSKK